MCSYGYAQKSLGTSLRFARSEPFMMIQYNEVFGRKFALESDLGFGLRSGVLQQRIHASMGLGFGCNVPTNNEFVDVLVLLKIWVSGYQLTPQSSIFSDDVSLGYSLRVGKNWKFLHAAFLGTARERQVGIPMAFSYFSYSISLGIGYAFN